MSDAEEVEWPPRLMRPTIVTEGSDTVIAWFDWGGTWHMGVFEDDD